MDNMNHLKTYRNTDSQEYYTDGIFVVSETVKWSVGIFSDYIKIFIPRITMELNYLYPHNLRMSENIPVQNHPSLKDLYENFSRHIYEDYEPVSEYEFQIDCNVAIEELPRITRTGQKEYILYLEERDKKKEKRLEITSRKKSQLEEICGTLLETQYNYRKKKALEREKSLDYDNAITIYEKMKLPEEAARVRRLKADLSSPKTVVHGDYIDDRDTIVKDSVINRSNVGAGGKTKGERIKLIKELLDSGAINEDDYEKMKREIIG